MGVFNCSNGNKKEKKKALLVYFHFINYMQYCKVVYFDFAVLLLPAQSNYEKKKSNYEKKNS